MQREPFTLPTSKNTKTRTSQGDKFKDLAHESEADENEAAFKKRLEKIAKPPKARK